MRPSSTKAIRFILVLDVPASGSQKKTLAGLIAVFVANMITQEILDAKWAELAEAEGQEPYPDPFDEWHKFLNDNNLKYDWMAESHWGEGGILDLIQDLIDCINSDQKLRVFTDPCCVGRFDCYGFLAFPC